MCETLSPSRSRTPMIAQPELQVFRKLVIDELEQPRARFDQRHLHAHRRQHAGVFNPDHPAADDDDRLGQLAEQKQLVAVDDFAGGKGDVARPGGLGADGDEDVLAANLDQVGAALPRVVAPRVMRSVLASTNDAVPNSIVTPLRLIWLRIMSTSVRTTC